MYSEGSDFWAFRSLGEDRVRTLKAKTPPTPRRSLNTRIQIALELCNFLREDLFEFYMRGRSLAVWSSE